MASNSVCVFDTTLRDGEQSPGVSLSAEQKITIAHQLCALGVNVCEIGFPACAPDLDSVYAIVDALGSSSMTLCALARCKRSDIDIGAAVLAKAKHARLHLFYPSSNVQLEHKVRRSQEQALEDVAESVAYARSILEDVEFSAEDASRAELPFLVQMCATAIAAGATTINVPDTVGVQTPDSFGEIITQLRAQVPGADRVTWSTHCHNDLGLATANTLAGVAAGARQVEVTINGIGERSGNAALEEVVVALRTLEAVYGVSTSINYPLLCETSRIVAESTGMAVQWNKAIVGRNAFLHESGVHVDGFLKHRATYEILDPASVGFKGEALDCVVLGKHSGRAAYRSVMSSWGFSFPSEAGFNAAFSRFQSLMEQNPRPSRAQLEATHAPTPEHVAPDTPNRDGVVRIVELLGDGVSEEVTQAAVSVLKVVAASSTTRFEFEQHKFGASAIQSQGTPLPDSTLRACQGATAVLLGAIGDPAYTAATCNGHDTPEQGLLRLRREMNLYQNVRPVKVLPALIDSSPLKPERIEGADLVFVRELNSGIYNAFHDLKEERAIDHMVYTKGEIVRITRSACDIAMHRRRIVTCIGKANVLACSQLWKRVVSEIVESEYPEITLRHELVDSASMRLLTSPTDYDVILTPNLFGDILSDEAAALTGSLGMLPSASLSVPSAPGLFEPVHGSAPEIAGKGIANPMAAILSAAMLLHHGLGMQAEADVVEAAVERALVEGAVTPDMNSSSTMSTQQVGSRISAFVQEALESANTKRRPMNLTEKILYHQSIGIEGNAVQPGQIILCRVARTLASEMTWVSMRLTYEALGKPKLWRKDRFWLAVDHTVDPSNYNDPKRQALVKACDEFAKDVDLVDFFGPNQTILHTEFYRQRAMPGTVIIGADSHSCSAGCLGAFATGLGAADVLMPVLSGQTWMKVPETILIELKGELAFGLTGKDLMLHILGKLKRNTVALERSVEFSGELDSLSIDSRFAIANMITEFGGIAGIFPSDRMTAAFLAGREAAQDDEGAMNFRADPGCHYAERFVIDMNDVTPSIAVYPSPDNVVAIDDPALDATLPEIGRSIRKLDGTFIGACTTTEEELILAALVLEAGLKRGMHPCEGGSRKVTPGSVQIVAKLERLGLLEVYRAAGFSVGAPGCSYCLAVAADVAPAGEVWLSSQNRNFRNRMGRGSFGNLSSAACVAASSFAMRISDPRPLLAAIDPRRFQKMLERQPLPEPESVVVHEPQPLPIEAVPLPATAEEERRFRATLPSALPTTMSGCVQRFGDSIDTDAIIPGVHMLVRPIQALGKFAFKFVRPEFVQRVAEGRNVVVAGTAFGSGSSREEAVLALVGCGVKFVIAKSFSFIFGRNLLCLNLFGICVTDEAFYELAVEGVTVSVDVAARFVSVADRRFTFELSPIQEQIYRGGGVVSMYKSMGKHLFKALTTRTAASVPVAKGETCCSSGVEGGPPGTSRMEW